MIPTPITLSVATTATMKRILKTIRNSSIKQAPNRSSHRPKTNDVGIADASPPEDEDYQDPGVELNPEEQGDRASNVYEEMERYYPSSSPVRTNAAVPKPLPPNRADETRNLVKKFIADIWNRGALDMIPVICSPSLRFNGNTGVWSTD
jgi:hypothetical protein